MEVKNKFFLEKNFIVYLGGRGVSALISVLAIPLFIRIFGVEDYGTFVLNYSIFLMALSFSNGWINQGVIRYYYKHEDKVSFLSQLGGLTLASSTLISIILSAFFLYRGESWIFLIIVFLSFIIGSLYLFKLIEAQSKIQPKKSIVAEIIRLSCFILIPWGLNSVGDISASSKIFLGVLTGYILGFAFLNAKERIYFFKMKYFRIEKKLLRTIAFYGIPLSIWMAFSPTTNGVDRYLVELYMGSIALAQYSAVYDIVFKVFSQLSIPLNSIVQPLLMYAHNKGEITIFKKTLFKAAIYLFSIFISIFIAFLFFKDLILVDYLGFKDKEILSELGAIIVPLIISSFVWQIAILFQKKLEANDKTLTMAFLMSFSILVSICFSIWLLPIYGFVASAYIMLGTSLLYLALIVVFVLKHENK